MSGNKRYYVYVYFDPRFDPPVPIYVGKGRKRRARVHLKASHNRRLAGRVRKIRKAGLEPILEIETDGLTSDEALQRECTLILEFGRLDLGTGTLCNLTEGGEGATGWVPSDQTRALWSEQRSRPQTPAQYTANCARSQSPAARSKISEANKGRKPSAATVAAAIEYNRTREITDEMRAKWSATRKAKGISQEHQRKMQEGKRRAAAQRTEKERAATVEKTAAKNRGKKRSEETKRKMREAWARRRERWGPSGHPPRE